MRLRRLDLVRYGKFTGHSIDFGAAVTGRPDLHIIYGPNEAGKSTTLSAFLDLLFGIETRSGYGFLHPYATMRIGAALDLDGVTQEFTRIKRPQNSLLDHKDQPVAGANILADLGGMDREAYRSMFSLDDKKLEEGGESILASKGDLGQLLFSASAGLADLSHGLLAIEAEAHGFYKFKARSGVLSDLKATLAALKAQREEIDTLAADYARLVLDRDAAGQRYDETIESRGRIQARIGEIERLSRALPRLRKLQGLREELARFADLPEAPPEWAGQLPALRKAEIELDVGLAAVAQDIEQRSAARDAIVLDEAALAQAERAEGLADARARHVTAEKDLPERRLQGRDADVTIAGILARIDRTGEAEPRRLLLKAPVAGVLRGLIETRSGIDAATRAATAELADAQRRVAEAQAKLRSTGAVDGRPDSAMAKLRSVVAAARTDDHAARRRLALRAGETARSALAERLGALRPWDGDADALDLMPVPDPETIAGWTARIAEAQKRLDRHAAEVERFTGERQEVEATVEAIGQGTGLVGDQDAERLRAAREEAWTRHRQMLDEASAEAFDAAMRSDDAATSARFAQVADLTTLRELLRTLAAAKARGRRAAELRDAATASLQSVRDEVAAAIESMSQALSPDMTPRQIENWIAHRVNALAARSLVADAARDLRNAGADAEAAQTRLTMALLEVGVKPEDRLVFDTLLVEAQAALDQDGASKALSVAVEERERDVASREREMERAVAEERRWTKAWTEACSAGWLAESGTVPSVDATREILAVLGDLALALDRQDSLAYRIRKMEEDSDAFEAAILDLAAAIGVEQGAAALDIARAIDRRIAEARARRAQWDEETRKIAEVVERQRTLLKARAIHDRQLATMATHLGVETLEQVASRLDDIDRRAELRRQAAEIERDILDTLRLTALPEAELMLDGADPIALETERAELATRFQDQDQRCHELFSTHSKAIDRVEAIGGDARVAEIEERRRTTMLHIEDGALRYLKLRAGTVATERALRVYRDRHRSSMLEGASKAFSTISRGAYSGLASQAEDNGEALIALAAGGGSKHAKDMSKGTRFQLYLALRVAGYHEFAKARPPVPFVADDIMETFDDFRAEEALRLFAGMAEVGQVIYLTHHRHVCDIARSIAPGVTIHEIAPADDTAGWRIRRPEAAEPRPPDP